MRGSDIDYNPVFFAYLIVTLDKIFVFVDQEKLPSNYAAHFEENQVKIDLLNYENIRDKLSALVSIKTKLIFKHLKQVYLTLHYNFNDKRARNSSKLSAFGSQ